MPAEIVTETPLVLRIDLPEGERQPSRSGSESETPDGNSKDQGTRATDAAKQQNAEKTQRVYSLQFAAAQQIHEILSAIKQPATVVEVHTRTNQVVVQATEPQHRELAEVIKQLDLRPRAAGDLRGRPAIPDRRSQREVRRALRRMAWALLLRRLQGPEREVRPLRRLAKTFRDGKTRQREEQGIDRQGNPTNYVVNIVPVVRDDGEIPFVIEMSRDIAELKTLQRQKLEAERLAAVGQTVAGLAHGIKNLIMGLEGGMYVVNSGLRSGNEERLLKGWKMLEEDIGRISSFVKEFLEFAKGRQPRAETIQPNDVAEKVVASFRERAARSGVDLRLDLGKLGEAMMDEEGLHTCLTNLVLNAIDACVMSTKEPSHVLLSTRRTGRRVDLRKVPTTLRHGRRDQAEGLHQFFSTKRLREGNRTGFTTGKIVQEQAGRYLESTEGEGSLFRLEFPREEPSKPQRDGEARERQRRVASGSPGAGGKGEEE